MLMLAHEEGVECPVKILLVADPCGFNAPDRVDHHSRPDRQAGNTQRTGEISNVFAKPAILALDGLGRVHAFSSARTSSSSWAARDPAILLMSS